MTGSGPSPSQRSWRTGYSANASAPVDYLLSLDKHGARTLPNLRARIGCRLLCLGRSQR